MENGHDDLNQPSTLFTPAYFGSDHLGWNMHANDTSNDVESIENGSPQRILTRRQRAAMTVGRAVASESTQVIV